MDKPEYFIDTEDSDNTFFTINNFKEPYFSKIHKWRYSNPIVQNETFSIYGGENMTNNREGFIIEIENNILIIQVKKDTKTRSPVLHCSEELMEMYLLSGRLTYDPENYCEYENTEEIQIKVLHILLSNCLLVITYSDENNLKIFIDEFNHKSADDILNRRLTMKLLDDYNSVHDSESFDKYHKHIFNCNCSSIKSTQVEIADYDIKYDNYINECRIYQIIQHGTAYVLVIKTYKIRFTHKNEQETISKKQIHFTIPQFPGLYFNDLENIEFDTWCNNKYIYNLVITYKDSDDNDFFLDLHIVDDYSKTLEGEGSRPPNETFDDYYYIFSDISDEIQIYRHNCVPHHVSSCKKLIGFIDFCTENDRNKDSSFEKQFIKLHLTQK